jgi:hypothetical protein
MREESSSAWFASKQLLKAALVLAAAGLTLYLVKRRFF